MSDDNGSPDTYSNAWYRAQFRGVMHSLNRCNAEYADCWEAVKELCARVDSLGECLESARSEIGQLKEEVAVAKEALTKARQEFGKLRKQVTAEG